MVTFPKEMNLGSNKTATAEGGVHSSGTAAGADSRKNVERAAASSVTVGPMSGTDEPHGAAAPGIEIPRRLGESAGNTVSGEPRSQRTSWGRPGSQRTSGLGGFGGSYGSLMVRAPPRLFVRCRHGLLMRLCP